MGIEGAGRVIEAGPASRLRPGTIVAIPSGGTWSERLAFADDAVLPLPAGVDMEQAAMLCVNPFTAVGLLEGVPEGGTIALNAGSAAVSRLVLALARRRGLRALAVVRNAVVADELIAAGAAAVLEDGPDLSRSPARGRRCTDPAWPGRRGRQRLGTPLRRPVGRRRAGGLRAPLLDRVDLPAAELVFRDVTVRGYSRLRGYAAMTPERRVEIGAELVGLLEGGNTFSPIEARYGLEDVRRAVAHHERPGRRGKILLTSPST